MNKGSAEKKVQKLVPKQSFDSMDQMEANDAKCQNKTYDCSLPLETGYQHCIKHILQDPTAPYKKCTFTFPNGKTCSQAKLSEDRKDSK